MTEVVDFMPHPQVMLVCTANVCRSPMALALWRAAARRQCRTVPAISAGLDAEPGRPADPACVGLLAERGLDLSEHRAQRFRVDLAADCELILVMEPGHARRIQASAPELAGRVQLLGRWGAGPIADPYRGQRAEYEECFDLLDHSVRAWLNRLP